MTDMEKQFAQLELDITPIIASQIHLEKCTYNSLVYQERYNGMRCKVDFNNITKMIYDKGYRKKDDVCKETQKQIATWLSVHVANDEQQALFEDFLQAFNIEVDD